MNYFVESESIKGESLRTLLTKCGEAPKGVMSLRHHWQEYVMEAGYWQAIWIYFIAPTLGMLAGAENPFVGSRRNSALLREAKSRQRSTALYSSTSFGGTSPTILISKEI